MKRERDQQRTAVYKFEQLILRTPQTQQPLFGDIPVNPVKRQKLYATQPHAAMIADTWRAEAPRYGLGTLAAPKLRYGRINIEARRSTNGSYLRTRHQITLAPLGATYGTLLHEIAHALTREVTESHGPEFVGVLIGLYRRYSALTWSVAHLVYDAEHRGLRVDPGWIEGEYRDPREAFEAEKARRRNPMAVITWEANG